MVARTIPNRRSTIGRGMGRQGSEQDTVRAVVGRPRDGVQIQRPSASVQGADAKRRESEGTAGVRQSQDWYTACWKVAIRAQHRGEEATAFGRSYTSSRREGAERSRNGREVGKRRMGAHTDGHAAHEAGPNHICRRLWTRANQPQERRSREVPKRIPD
jgi:hypothetical protein